MTDERLAEITAERDKADDARIVLKRQMEDSMTTLKRLASESTRVSEARKQLVQPYKDATEKVADLTSQIRAEQSRRDDEAARAKQAEREAAEAAAKAEKSPE
jgi:hypothetical protein